MSVQSEAYQQLNFSKIQSQTYLNSPQASFNSPRQYFQRKPEASNFQRRKRPTEKDAKTLFCYISPTRQIKNIHAEHQPPHPENTSLFELKHSQNTQTTINSQTDLIRHQYTRRPIKTDTIAQLKSANDEYRNLNHELKMKNIDYMKQIKSITAEKDKLQKQFIKMQDYVKKVQSECKQYKEAKEIISKSLEIQRKGKQAKQQLSRYLEDVIIQLNYKIQILLNKQKANLHQSHTIMQDFEQQLIKLKETLKYYHIQNGILKKKNLQNENCKLQIEKVKQQNKKLELKINNLTKMKHRLISKNDQYDPIFQLSPEKD